MLTKIKTSFILLIISLSALGQGRDMSEIKSKILQAQSEKEKIEGFIDLGVAFGKQYPDSILIYRDSLRTEEFTSSELTEAAMLFLNAVASYNSGNLQKAIGELEVSAQKLKESEMLSAYYRNLNLLGVAYSRTREYNQAIDILNEVIEQSPDSEDFISAKSAAYANISNAYKRLGEYAEAINALEESLILAKAFNQYQAAEALAFTYFNLAQMLLILEEAEEAKATYLSIDLDKVRGPSMKAAILSDLGQTYFKLEQYDSAKIFTERSLEVASSSRNLQQIIQPSILLSKLYLNEKAYEEALDILEKPTTYCETNRCPPPAIVDLNIAQMEILKAQGNLELAKTKGIELTDYLDKNAVNHLSKNTFSILGNIYEELGNQEKALYYQKLYSDISQTFRDENRVFKEKSELEELKTMRAQRQLAAVESEKSLYQYLTIPSIAITVFLIGVIIYGYRYYKRKDSSRESITKSQDGKSEDERNTEKPKRYINLKSKAIIDIDQITYVSSDGPYIEIYQKDKEKPEVDRNTLKNVLEQLPSSQFVQIHRSYIINVSQVKSLYASKVILNDETELNVSRTYKPIVQSKLKVSA